MIAMAKKERYPNGYYRPAIRAAGGSEDSGSSGHTDVDMTGCEDPSVPMRKCIRLNNDQFYVPVRVHQLSMMSLSERKDLLNRLRLELEQILVFQKKMELMSINGTSVSMSGDIRGYGNDHSARAKPNKGQGSKLAPSSRLDPAQQGYASGSSMRMAMKQCETLLERLMAHTYANVFGAPVDVVKWNIPDYFTIIKHPMDLGTVKGKLASGAYSNPSEFVADVRLTFTNAMTYNPPKNEVHMMAKTLSKFFEVRWKTIEKKLPPVNLEPVPVPESIGTPRNVDASGFLMPPVKKRKIPAVQHEAIPHEAIPQPVQRIMTADEKQRLSMELANIIGELPDNIINFLKEHCSNGAEAAEDEIEIDLDVLSNETVFELRKLLDDYLQQVEKNSNKMAEPCEMELAHGSGISNSSMQAGKGNDDDDDAADEEIDIGGSEPPVTSYPPIEIDKDLGQRSGSEPSSSTDDEPDNPDAPCDTSRLQEEVSFDEVLNKKTSVGNSHEEFQSGSGLDQVAQNHETNRTLAESDCQQDGESAPGERQLSPDKLYRAALLKSRFADTILKAREKTLNQVDNGDPEKLRREREELELQKRKEKARLQAEAKAAEDARKRAEAEAAAEAAAEAKKKRELEREAARQALLQMEKTVEINENCRILEDLEKLRTGPAEHLPSSVDETSPDHSQDGIGGFMFGGSNPLEQLGLFMKEDEEEEEAEPPSLPNELNDVEEGEV